MCDSGKRAPAQRQSIQSGRAEFNADLAVGSIAVDGTDVTLTPDDAMVFTNGETCDTGGELAVTASNNPGSATVTIAESDSPRYTPQGTVAKNVDVTVVPRIVRLAGGSAITLLPAAYTERKVQIVDEILGAPGDVPVTIASVNGTSATAADVDADILDDTRESAGAVTIQASDTVTGLTTVDITLGNGFVFDETDSDTLRVSVYVVADQPGAKIEWATPAPSAAPTSTPLACLVDNLKGRGVDITPTSFELYRSNGWMTGRSLVFNMSVDPGAVLLITGWSVQFSNDQMNPTSTLNVTGDISASLGSGAITAQQRTVNVDAPDTPLQTGNYTFTLFMQDPLTGDGAWISVVKYTINVLYFQLPAKFTVSEGSLKMFTNSSGSTTVTIDPPATGLVKADLAVIDDTSLVVGGLLVDGTHVTATPDDAMVFTNGQTCDTGGVLTVNSSNNAGTATVSVTSLLG